MITSAVTRTVLITTTRKCSALGATRRDGPISLEALREVASRLPVHVYRAKGVIYTADAPRRRAVLQVVGKRVDISLQDAWGGRAPHTQIVAIGALGGIDPQALQKMFEQCLRAPDGAQ